MEEEEVCVGKGVEQVLLMGQGFLASVMCSTDNEKNTTLSMDGMD